jgi:hypothetical protein
MKTCPRCYSAQDDSALECDCGYTFSVAGSGAVGRLWQALAGPLLPRCPECGSEDRAYLSRGDEDDAFYWTYRCTACGNLYYKRSVLLHLFLAFLKFLGFLLSDPWC